ncbi:hypothetical protein [Ilumatobacter sp.]|uniref:hypothetical protein n=1 Tax=Ilumatobacter sp. TaxID=1967498 RepID=UPI003AF5226E
MTSRTRFVAVALVPILALVACGGDEAADSTTQETEPAPTAGPATTTESTSTTEPLSTDTVEMVHGGGVDTDLLVPAYLGAAPFQDVSVAEAAGWVNTAETLGCFQDAERGGMGVHWLNESLLDAELDPAVPEALVYELDVDGEVAGLVGHEYLVPFEAWTHDEPPTLFGLDFHEHPVLPFWILHAYLWKDNPNGMFTDFNPAVRMCPEGVGVFGVDLP